MPDNPARRHRIRLGAEVAPNKLDALLVSSLPNIRYLTGFTGSNGMLLAMPDRAVFFTDPRYEIQAAREVDCPVRVCKGPLIPKVVAALGRYHVRRLGFEKARLSFEAYEHLKRSLPLGVSLHPLGPLVETHRMVKSEDEIERIRRSVLLNSRAFEEVLPCIRPGMREGEVAAELEYRMRLLGAEKPSFDTIVAAGARSALPHAQAGPERLQAGLTLIDMGAMLGGYASDMTRVLHLGRASRKVRELYQAVLESQLAAVDAVRPGVSGHSVDRAARQVLKARGLDKAFVHSTGHGLGLEIHEPPRIGRKEKTTLEPGMTITIEPGAYLGGFGGVRIEDTVLVTTTGHEVLTPTPKELREL
ncbi:MAG: Xaa-Pro peptidase family protein [Bryobacteraceae bacterium]